MLLNNSKMDHYLQMSLSPLTSSPQNHQDCENNFNYLKRKFGITSTSSEITTSCTTTTTITTGMISSSIDNQQQDEEQQPSSISYIQHKKRLLLNFENNTILPTQSTHFSENCPTSISSVATSSSSTDIIQTTTALNYPENVTHHQQISNLNSNPTDENVNCSDNLNQSYNLSVNGGHNDNNPFSNECQSMNFFNYDGNIPNIIVTTSSAPATVVDTISETDAIGALQTTMATVVVPVQDSIFISNLSNNNETDENECWQHSDLLELDHRYNSVVNISVNDQHHESIIHHHHDQQQHLMQQHHHTNHLQQQSDLEKDNMTSHTSPDTDFEDKNLSWLFNFKLDELPHLSPEVNRLSSSSTVTADSNHKNPTTNTSKHHHHQSKIGKKVDELILEATSSEIEENEISVAENITVENNARTPKKPPFTYTELIEYALEDKRELTVSGIYQWISDRFPFYKSNDDRWKNSVRHNLSINPHFRKGVKAPQGAGHLWTIASRDSEENTLAWEHKKQRLELFFRMEKQHQSSSNSVTNINSETDDQQHQSTVMNSTYEEAATAAANLLQQLQNEDDISDSRQQISPTLNAIATSNTKTVQTSILNNHNHQSSQEISEEDLQKTAGEILNGVRRNVEVQSLNSLNSTQINTYHDSFLETDYQYYSTGDYLNPINKDVAMVESSLRPHHNGHLQQLQNHNGNRNIDISNDYYITEIDPIELGINMPNVEEEVLFGDEFNLNYFGITSGNDIVA